ncbi:BlaI/MecI/CopY family transcriptional regulator [candidate division GN15 bacterium]|nr:BlaI/MecI/CopY family transcriptional regulator [candidate division GN15 bacterium]
MTPNPFYFDPDATGVAVFLGPTEARLMELAWEKGELTVKKAQFFLGENNQRAYTTTMTVLSRLAQKGLLSREKQGKHHLYRPALSREDFLTRKIATVTDCLDRNFNR